MARNTSILIIDDEEIMREILETLLTREGYEVRLASSGHEGLELARRTIAKYREELKITTSNQRKVLY